MHFMDVVSHTNYWAVLVCVVFAIVLGSVWYMPKTFYGMYAKALGVESPSRPDRKKAMQSMMLLTLMTVVEMFGLAWLIGMAGGGLAHALVVGMLVSVFVALASRFGEWLFISKPYIVWTIPGGYK